MKLAEITGGKHPEKSIEYLKKARACAKELNEEFYIVSSNVAMGDFYYRQKDYKNALIYYKEAQQNITGEFSSENKEKINMRIEDIRKIFHEE